MKRTLLLLRRSCEEWNKCVAQWNNESPPGCVSVV